MITRQSRKQGQVLRTISGFTIPRGYISPWAIEPHMRSTMGLFLSGSAPKTLAKGYSPSAHPGGGWQKRRDSVPRTLAKGQAPLQSPVFFLSQNTGNEETMRLTKSTGKTV